MLIIDCDIVSTRLSEKPSNGLEPIGRRSRRCQWVPWRHVAYAPTALPGGSLNEVGARRDGRRARARQIAVFLLNAIKLAASSRGLGFLEEREQIFQRLARGL